MRRTIVFISFFFILFFITSCAEQGVEISLEEISQQISDEESIVEEKETFKQYDVNANGDYEFECTEQQQSRINTFGGNIHTIWSATSEDGITWTEEQYIQPGSVPEVIFFNDKFYLFTMGSCLMYISDNGLEFEPYTYTLKNENIPEDFRNFGGVDPTAIIDNGKIRLFFYEPLDTETLTDPAWIPGKHTIVQYVSEDAVRWQRVGEAVAVEGITDSDIVYYHNSYYLFLSHGQSVIATSSEDGVTFSSMNDEKPVHFLGGVSDTIVMNDALYMYVHKNINDQIVIKIIKSTDGISWEEVGTAIEDGEAPSVLQLADGTYRMYYVKSLSEEEYEELVAE